ncbi:hypothetical protein TcasGA2_TC012703 [Tribolium castaneum]|uniref:Uncharacterized protein n=1 Tax=Tribolium castaneum TaxID=7070 RepID=D6WZP7_TRICA|nr:hypothetical protein TcasGA2_TC012703 [Tribolium castaneum]
MLKTGQVIQHRQARGLPDFAKINKLREINARAQAAFVAKNTTMGYFAAVFPTAAIGRRMLECGPKYTLQKTETRGTGKR